MRSRVLESERVWLWAIVIVGGFLRLYRLDDQSLWVDEGLQYYVASNNSIAEMLFTQMRSFHPPLSFLINHAFLLIGESEFFLRLPSALFGIASLPVFYILARELTSRRVALFSTFVLAVSPFHVWYSQEGRMYAQVLFFSLLSSVVLLQAVQRGEARWWVYYILVSAAGMYTQVFMGLALITHFVWVLLYRRSQLVWITASGITVAVLFLPWALFLPWVSFFFHRVSEHGIVAASPSIGRAGFSRVAVPYTFFAYSAGFSVGPTVAELHGNRSLGFIMQFAPEILSVSVVFGTLLLVGVAGSYKLFGGRSTSYCLLGLCLPILGTLLYAIAPRASYNVRYTIVAFPYFCILLGTGVSLLFQKYRPAGVILSLGVVVISSTSLGNHFFNPRYAKEDIRSAVAFWRSQSTGDPLLSFKAHHVAPVYLAESEERRHFRLSGDVVSDIRCFLSKNEASSVYILLARDWGKLKENSVREAFRIDLEKSYPGVILFKIPNSRKAHDPAGAL